MMAESRETSYAQPRRLFHLGLPSCLAKWAGSTTCPVGRHGPIPTGVTIIQSVCCTSECICPAATQLLS